MIHESHWQVWLLIFFLVLFCSFQDKSCSVPGNLKALDCLPINIIALIFILNELQRNKILWTYYTQVVLDPSVHTNPFSNGHGAVLLRILLSSTLQRRKRSPKTEPFENALYSGAIWKRCFLKTLFSSADGKNDAIWRRWRHQNRHDRAPDHSTVSIQNGVRTLPCGFSLDLRCSVDGRKR